MFFSKDIPFKGSQCLLNMRVKVTAVSYLLTGVIETAVPCALCSRVRFPYKKKHWVELFAKIFEKKLVAQRCKLHHYMHSGVIDTAVQPTCRLSSWIRSHIPKDFNLFIRDTGEVVLWKNRGWKSRVRVPLTSWSTGIYSKVFTPASNVQYKQYRACVLKKCLIFLARNISGYHFQTPPAPSPALPNDWNFGQKRGRVKIGEAPNIAGRIFIRFPI
jgi:hypothetical protein